VEHVSAPCAEPRPAPAGLELVTATNGNQGRALAHVGRLLGLPVRVLVPRRRARGGRRRDPRGTRQGGGRGAPAWTCPLGCDCSCADA